MPRFVTCGPNEAIIVSGCCRSSPTIRAGGRVFVWPVFHRIQRLSLNTMTINVESPKVHSDGGVPVTVKGVAQVKIQGKDLTALRAATEMFLDKSEDEIMDIAKATLDGYQRSVIASKKIEDIYGGRHAFSRSVQQSAQSDLFEMGLTLVSYTVQDISDEEGYLDAIGQRSTVGIRSAARKAVALAKRQADLEKLHTDYKKQQVQLHQENQVALKRLEFETAEAKYLTEQFKSKARSEKAGEEKLASINMKIADENLGVVLLEKEKENELILKKRDLKKLELNNSIKQKANHEADRQRSLAEAYKVRAKLEADQEADKLLKLAKARATATEQQRQAEANVLAERALAFKEFGGAAKLEMVLAILPRLTAEVAGPIADCKKITSVSQDGSVGFSRITNEILEVVERVCESVSNVNGLSLHESPSASNDTDDRPPPPGDRRDSRTQLSSDSPKPSSSTLGSTTLSRYGSSFTRSGGRP